MTLPLPLATSEFPAEITAVVGTVQRMIVPVQGDTSAVALVESASGRYVVKRSRGERFSGWLRQEYRVLGALASTSLPTPHPYAFAQREATGEPETWLVMEWLPGEPLIAALGRETVPEARQMLLRAFGEVLACIHRATIPADLRGNARPWLERMLEQAEYNLLQYPVEGDATLLETLKRHRPAPAASVLIHGDFTVDNVLVADGRVTGVIDWAGGGPGDSRYDLALAIRPQRTGLFQTPEDRRAFFAGYGLADLSAAEYDYFVGLYEFF